MIKILALRFLMAKKLTHFFGFLEMQFHGIQLYQLDQTIVGSLFLLS